MPLIETKGAASSGAYGQFARQVAANYIEDVFSTYLYTGNGSTQTITNGIDLSTKGGMLWIKGRSAFSSPNLYDTARGANKVLFSSQIFAEATNVAGKAVTSFNANGFSLGPNDYSVPNNNGDTYVSWTFRKQAKFFDIVTYTGNGSSSRLINHSLGSAPGLVIIKTLNIDSNWPVMFAPTSGNAYGFSNALSGGGLNTNAAGYSLGSVSGVSTATQFRVGSSYWGAGSETNDSGATYVAYVFANNGGGFGASGTENAITCGTYTGNGSTTGPIITLGYEPQFLLIKNREAGTYEDWVMVDTMRGLSVNGPAALLFANVGNSEGSNNPFINVSATGFQPVVSSSRINASGNNYMYMAIRRGPMRTPTSGTSVFSVEAWTGSNTDAVERFNNTFSSDVVLSRNRTNNIGANTGTNPPTYMTAKLAGAGVGLSTMFTNAETDFQGTFTFLNKSVVFPNANPPFNINGDTFVGYSFLRAPGFFDVVCYTGDGTSNRNLNHSLGVTPSFIIAKRRNANFTSWWTWLAAFNGGVGYGEFNSTGQFGVSTTVWGTGSPTSTTFPVNSSSTNTSTGTFVAYLFADCPGVCKAGIYAGTGAAQTINCGFTGGARFVLIKRTTGSPYDWYVWDTARGISAGNDPYLLLSSTAPETTGTDYISVQSSGFGLTATAPVALNASGVNYLFLAIA